MADSQEDADPVGAKEKIVGIGASAGGLDACQELLRHLPSDSGLAFIIVLHLSPHHESRVAELLQRSTSMPVSEARDGQRPEPNHVYVIPPDGMLRLAGGAFVIERPLDGVRGRVVDALFHSLASELGEQAAVVVLSGTAADGAEGVVSVEREGGLVLVQSPETAEHSGMPESAIATGRVDAVLPIREMAASLAAFAEREAGKGESVEDAADAPKELEPILSLLGKRYSVDFGAYKIGTLKRRIDRRVELAHASGWAEYLERLRRDGKEVDALFDELLIGVTHFFRDPDVWEAFETRVAPRLLDDHPPAERLRVWVPGCATGEEAYTIGMILLDLMAARGASYPLQIFATDLDGTAIATARTGHYSEDVAADIPRERLEKYMRREGGFLRVSRRLRECITFSVHNILSDPPFAKLDLISCRNLLIYLLPGAQERVAEVFHFALRPAGYLLLGRSESLGRRGELFETVDKGARIYRRAAVTRTGWYPNGRRERRLAPPSEAPRSTRAALADSVEAAVLNRYTAPCVIVNRALQILYFFGATGRFLVQPPGEARLDLPAWTPLGLYAAMRRALEEVLDTGVAVALEGVPLERDGAVRRVSCSVEPLDVPNLEGLIAVVFREEQSTAAQTPPDEKMTPLERTLEAELKRTQDELRRTVEELRRVEEIYRAEHEESLALNEELQSGNEELETSKEELQSINEELETVNRQLQERNDDLHALNDDLNNLLASTDIPVLFLDGDLRIRRLTPTTASIARLRHDDVGRRLDDVRLTVEDPCLFDDAQAVTRDHSPRRADVGDGHGRWFARTIQPYRVDGVVGDGVCVTYVDISEARRQADAVDEALHYAEAIIRTSRTPMLVLDSTLAVQTANEQFHRTFRTRPGEVEGKLLYEIGGGTWDVPVLRELLQTLLPEKKELRSYEVEHEFGHLGHRVMKLNAYEMERADRPSMILLVIEDVTEAREAERAINRYAAELSRAHRQKDEFLAMLGHELRNPLSAIAQGVRLLTNTPENPERREKVHALLARQTKRLATLVDQLLDVSRVISGKTVLQMEAVDVGDIAAATIESLEHVFDQRRQTVHTRLPQRGEAIVRGDPVRLTQVLENLLGNASKYTEPGGNLWLTVEPGEDDVRVCVRDDGMGISPQLLPRIFEPFTQEARAMGRAQGGLGLGLPLVKGLVNMHGGAVRAESEGLGRGSEFTVTLPKLDEALVVPGPTPPDPPKAAYPCRVLVIDDEVDLADSLAELLRDMGHDVVAVHTGAAGVTAVETFHPNVVLVDLGLPDVEGYEVARRIRATHPPNEVRIVALTGYTRDHRRLTEAGIDDHVLKPPDVERLRRCVEPPKSS